MLLFWMSNRGVCSLIDTSVRSVVNSLQRHEALASFYQLLPDDLNVGLQTGRDNVELQDRLQVPERLDGNVHVPVSKALSVSVDVATREVVDNAAVSLLILGIEEDKDAVVAINSGVDLDSRLKESPDILKRDDIVLDQISDLLNVRRHLLGDSVEKKLVMTPRKLVLLAVGGHGLHKLFPSVKEFMKGSPEVELSQVCVDTLVPIKDGAQLLLDQWALYRD